NPSGRHFQGRPSTLQFDGSFGSPPSDSRWPPSSSDAGPEARWFDFLAELARLRGNPEGFAMHTTRIQIANAPCSWGVLEFDLPGQALGYAQVLNEIKETGYAGTELGDWGFMPTDPATLRAELKSRGLQLIGAFVQVAFANEKAHAAGEEQAVKTARLMSDAV